MLKRRERWRDEIGSVRRMHARVLAAERILCGEELREEGLPISNATVAKRFDAWCSSLREQLSDEHMSESERRCLEHFLHVTDNMRKQLLQCYDVEGLPRTNNDMEGFIRSIKTRYRRISGRKNWNRYLLRYGRRVVYYESQVRAGRSVAEVGIQLQGLGHERWRSARAEQWACQQEQLKQYRVRHRRKQFLESLEARWSETAQRTLLLP